MTVASDDSAAEQDHMAVVTRPSGKVYRARRRPFVEFLMWNDGSAVLCTFTHDVERVTDDARALWAGEVGTDLPEPQLIWIKKVPWDALGQGWDTTIMAVSGDTKGSTPAVLFGDDA